jgi:hypothetical protein
MVAAAFSSQSVITFGAAMATSGVRARTVDVSRMPRRDVMTPFHQRPNVRWRHKEANDGAV